MSNKITLSNIYHLTNNILQTMSYKKKCKTLKLKRKYPNSVDYESSKRNISSNEKLAKPYNS